MVWGDDVCLGSSFHQMLTLVIMPIIEKWCTPMTTSPTAWLSLDQENRLPTHVTPLYFGALWRRWSSAAVTTHFHKWLQECCQLICHCLAHKWMIGRAFRSSSTAFVFTSAAVGSHAKRPKLWTEPAQVNGLDSSCRRKMVIPSKSLWAFLSWLCKASICVLLLISVTVLVCHLYLVFQGSAVFLLFLSGMLCWLFCFAKHGMVSFHLLSVSKALFW